MPTKKQPAAGFECGDSVYCSHPERGPLIVRVLASGADGFTAETEDGERMKVPHDKYLGHRQRVKHAYVPVDVGEDGALVQDETGTRRFIAGPLPTPPKDKPARDNANRFSRVHTQDMKIDGAGSLSKAFTPILAMPLPPLPSGLALLLKAANTGSVRPVKPQPPAKRPLVKSKPKKAADDDDEKHGPALHKHGDYVAFRHEDVEGCGIILGSGQDGVTILDEATGREHLVRHDAICKEHPPLPKPKAGNDAIPLDKTDKPAKVAGGKSDASRLPSLKAKDKSPK